MRHQNLTIAALGALALLAGCSNKEAAAPADAALTAEEIAEKRAELDRLEAELAQQQAAPTQPATPSAAPAPKPATASGSTAAAKPATSTAKPATTAPAKPQTIIVPPGTEIPVALVGALSTKSAKVGQPVQARVTSDVVVDGRTAIPQGITVAGSVVEVVSGSDRIGGTPTLLLAFDRIQLPNGVDVPINGEFKEKGKSDNTRDTVKIVGGAAAGALLADQIGGSKKKDRNRVIGGILGAAAGAVAAKETGTEVKIEDGAPLTLILSDPVEIPRS
jgi:outer membrane lipoprotein SlyB